MDKLNSYVKAGIFVDKDKDGFTKAEKKALGEEFVKLHQERGDLTNFKKMLAGKYFDYKNEEFVRLAKAAGYVLAEEVQASATKPRETEPEVKETKASENVPKTSEVKDIKQEDKQKVEDKPKTVEQKPSTTDSETETLHKELETMKATWSEDEKAHPDDTLRRMLVKVNSEISELEKPYTKEVVNKKRFLRKAKKETVQTPKTEEQLKEDKIKAQEKRAELDKIAKMIALAKLYSCDYPSKYAPGDNDKFLSGVVTTKDGKKYGEIQVRKAVYNKKLNFVEHVYVNEYYPITLRQHELREGQLPAYYYGVDKEAKPVEGKIELVNGKVVQE